jgi:beta-lactamase regulating signal transducer with metallopeptidase domain
MSDFLLYLLQVSVCHTAFFVLFRFFFRRHTFFQPNRFYLLFTTCISFIIPLLNIGVWNQESMENSIISPLIVFSEMQMNSELPLVVPSYAILDGYSIIEVSVFLLYVIGVLFYGFKLIRGLTKVISLIHENTAINKGPYKIISAKSSPSFFSFSEYIFINDHGCKLSIEELNAILSHENTHIQQKHTVDILFLELITVFFWFNPIIHKIKNSICQIHEYIADSQVISKITDIDTYSRLILKLSTSKRPIPLTHQFSMIHIKNRITMLNQSKNNKMKTIKYLLALPMVLFLMSFFSCTDKAMDSTNEDEVIGGKELIIGEILWEGNTKYSDDYLSGYLKIKKGSVYSREKIDDALAYRPGEIGISDLYMNEGHLYYNIDIEEQVIENIVNIKFKMYEGITVEIDKIIIKGNSNVTTEKVMKMIDFQSGELFNRLKIIESQKIIAESGYFKSDEIGINPIPHDDALVDIEFVLIEL